MVLFLLLFLTLTVLAAVIYLSRRDRRRFRLQEDLRKIHPFLNAQKASDNETLRFMVPLLTWYEFRVWAQECREAAGRIQGVYGPILPGLCEAIRALASLDQGYCLFLPTAKEPRGLLICGKTMLPGSRKLIEFSIPPEITHDTEWDVVATKD